MPAAQTLGGFAMWLDLEVRALPSLGSALRSSHLESWPLVLGGVVACALVAHELLLPLTGSSLTIHFADRVSSRGFVIRIRFPSLPSFGIQEGQCAISYSATF